MNRREGVFYCHVAAQAGIPLAARLARALALQPWQSPGGASIGKAHFYAPIGHAVALVAFSDLPIFCLCEKLAQELRSSFQKAAAHIFIGACGLAVRLIAPCLVHKSVDPPVVVLDPAGRNVVSLLSGHWGGANSLAEHLATLLDARAVITTESDVCGHPALDLFLARHDIRILDWRLLARAQASLARGEQLALYDPHAILPETSFLRAATLSEAEASSSPGLVLDWHRTEERPGLLRLVPGGLYLGLGFRKNIGAACLEQAFNYFMELEGIELMALSGLASVDCKEEALRPLASKLGLPLQAFSADSLAAVPVPDPSRACGKRFGREPFSVCEAAALLAAGWQAGKVDNPVLIRRKLVWNSCVTLAMAARAPRAGRKVA